jgi:hypothetical protein
MLMWLTRTQVHGNGAEIFSAMNICASAALAKKKGVQGIYFTA